MSGESNRQIKQMVNFIMQEAHEKVNEIRIKVREDLPLTPLSLSHSLTVIWFGHLLPALVDRSRYQPREAESGTHRQAKGPGGIQSEAERPRGAAESVSDPDLSVPPPPPLSLTATPSSSSSCSVPLARDPPLLARLV